MPSNETLALSFKALAHPRRVRIFRLLATTPEAGDSFLSLQKHTGLCESSLSHHIREMERSGLLLRRRKGVFARHVLTPTALQLALGITQSICQSSGNPTPGLA
jgi:ArsR family transcriptional regulator